LAEDVVAMWKLCSENLTVKLFSNHIVGTTKEGCGDNPVVLATKFQAMHRYQKAAE